MISLPKAELVYSYLFVLVQECLCELPGVLGHPDTARMTQQVLQEVELDLLRVLPPLCLQLVVQLLWTSLA